MDSHIQLLNVASDQENLIFVRKVAFHTGAPYKREVSVILEEGLNLVVRDVLLDPKDRKKHSRIRRAKLRK